MYVDVIFAERSFKSLDILCITDLNDQLSPLLLDFAFKHVNAVLGNPNYIYRQSCSGVAATSILNR